MSQTQMKVGEFHSADLTAAVTNILDTFSGADGGAGFVMFCAMLRQIDRLAIEGDPNSLEITNVVRHFSALLEIAQRTETT